MIGRRELAERSKRSGVFLVERGVVGYAPHEHFPEGAPCTVVSNPDHRGLVDVVFLGDIVVSTVDSRSITQHCTE